MSYLDFDVHASLIASLTLTRRLKLLHFMYLCFSHFMLCALLMYYCVVLKNKYRTHAVGVTEG